MTNTSAKVKKPTMDYLVREISHRIEARQLLDIREHDFSHSLKLFEMLKLKGAHRPSFLLMLKIFSLL